MHRAAVDFLAAFRLGQFGGVAAALGSVGQWELLFDVGSSASMERKTGSLLPLILRLLIAAAIAGVLSLCSLAIEKKFPKHSNDAATYNRPIASDEPTKPSAAFA